MQIQPYLFFEGRCDEALDFYREALGAKVQMLTRRKDNPDAPVAAAAGLGDKIMHASFRVGQATICASDGRCAGVPDFRGFALSLTVAEESEAERFFTALADGGKITTPLSKTFFSPRFGMVADRFGVTWIIYVAGNESDKN